MVTPLRLYKGANNNEWEVIVTLLVLIFVFGPFFNYLTILFQVVYLCVYLCFFFRLLICYFRHRNIGRVVFLTNFLVTLQYNMKWIPRRPVILGITSRMK